ncbi:MAG: DUF2927 domain-containing protein [Pseudomonadota bacterium]
MVARTPVFTIERCPVLRKRSFRLLLFSILFLSISAPVQTETVNPHVYGFMKTVFGTEHDRSWWFSGVDRVKKYTVPVRFYIYQRARKDRRAAVRRFVEDLPRHIPGLDARLAVSPKEANFHIFIVDRADFVESVVRDAGLTGNAGRNAECLVHIWFGRRGISESRAVIVSDRGEHLFRRCLVEEVLQGLGPINDSPDLPDSVFNDLSRHARLTEFDRTLLQMLYHPAIKPGMGRRDVAPLLPSVLADLGQAR